MAPPIPPEASKEIELVRGLVAKHFPVYDVRVTYDVVEFFCRVDVSTLDDEFEKLRVEMGESGYIPMIVYDKGEHIITVAKKPLVKYRSIYVNIALLTITFLTVLLAGAISWAGYDSGSSDDLFSSDNLIMGMLYFTLPLMGILGVHELAHYLAARRRKVAASLPFFIFGPPPLGTFGAFISLRDPIPNKKALLEIGVAGPIAGMLLAIPLGFLGLILTNEMAIPVPVNIGSEGVVGVNFPLLYSWISEVVPVEGDYLLHPLAFSAWVGFLVTALNLLPFGQLDGGHVARALLGARSKYLGYVTIAILLGIGMVSYVGWLIFAVFVFILGARHPPPLNDISPLGKKHMIVGVLTFVLLAVAFVPIPMETIRADYSFDLVPLYELDHTVPLGESHEMRLFVENVGNSWNEIEFAMGAQSDAGFSVQFKPENESVYAEDLIIGLNASESTVINVLATVGLSMEVGQYYNLTVVGRAINSTDEVREITYNITVANPTFTYFIEDFDSTVAPGESTYVNLLLNNTGSAEITLTLQPASTWLQVVDILLSHGASNSTDPLNVTVAVGESETVGVFVDFAGFCPPGDMLIVIEVYREGVMLNLVGFQVTVT